MKRICLFSLAAVLLAGLLTYGHFDAGVKLNDSCSLPPGDVRTMLMRLQRLATDVSSQPSAETHRELVRMATALLKRPAGFGPYETEMVACCQSALEGLNRGRSKQSSLSDRPPAFGFALTTEDRLDERWFARTEGDAW